MRRNNLLTDPLPETVILDDVEYPIETDYRVVLRCLALLEDDTVPEFIAYALILQMFYGDQELPDNARALEALLDFLYCGEYEPHEETNEQESEPLPDKRLMDYTIDSPLIYAAFLQQYGIDLVETSYMHWWQFKALMAGLSDTTELMRVIGIRGMEITSDMTKTQKRLYTKLKRRYALPDRRTEQERDGDFARALFRM